MNWSVDITTREEYDYARSRGYEPLQDRKFKMDHALRVEIQKELFGGNDAEGNAKFYKWCLAHKPLVCEECGKSITHPSAVNVSHILSRGSHPEMAHDPRNVNILCWWHHQRYEQKPTRIHMGIFRKTEKMIEKLKKEYNIKD